MKTFDGTVGCWRHHNTAAIYNAPYGPNDNFDLLFGNVLLAVLANIHAAMRKRRNTVEIWGSGPPRREFFHVGTRRLSQRLRHFRRRSSPPNSAETRHFAPASGYAVGRTPARSSACSAELAGGKLDHRSSHLDRMFRRDRRGHRGAGGAQTQIHR